MSKRHKTKHRKAGLSPGTLTSAAPHIKHITDISLIHYTETTIEEKKLSSLEECLDYKDKPGVVWINIEGVKQIEVIEKIGQAFNLHPLLLEDIVIGEQRPKIDDYEEHLFLVMTMLTYDEKSHEIKSEQVSFVLGPNFVLSFQEEGVEGDVFNPNRERLRSNRGRGRKLGPDYLLYALIDTIVDNYFLILEKMGDELEEMEIKLISHPSPPLLHAIYKLKREIIYLRKHVWPLREVISRMEKDESPLIKESTKIFIKDVYDHTIQVIDTIESYRDVLGGMLDIYLSSLSNRMNSIIKVLTMMSTIFIPLTFIVGVYGMNFQYFPELRWKYGYFTIWGVMIVISIGMLIYFRKKKWL